LQLKRCASDDQTTLTAAIAGLACSREAAAAAAPAEWNKKIKSSSRSWDECWPEYCGNQCLMAAAGHDLALRNQMPNNVLWYNNKGLDLDRIGW
jgi:hypothetical protein